MLVMQCLPFRISDLRTRPASVAECCAVIVLQNFDQDFRLGWSVSMSKPDDVKRWHPALLNGGVQLAIKFAVCFVAHGSSPQPDHNADDRTRHDARE